MSMLTPSGKVVRSQPRRGGAGGRAVAVLVVLLVFVAVGAGAWWFLLKPEPAKRSAGCPTPSSSAAPTVIAPAPKAVRLNVYNATSRVGLASTVAALMRARGFVVVKVANDPLHRRVTGVAEIRHSAKGLGAAKTVSAHVGAVEDIPDERKDATVDLVLGARYSALRTPAQARATLLAKPTASPSPTC
jgi:hypothetical protein